MRHTKLFDATLDVPNPIAFCTNKSKQAMARLKATYEGRCFKGAYILSVDSITKISDCRITRGNHSGGGFVDVQFSATIIVLARWDIITGIQIRRSDTIIVGEVNRKNFPKVIVSFVPSADIRTIRVGQTVSARTIEVAHPSSQPHIIAVGSLLTCETVAPNFKVVGKLDTATAKSLIPLVAEIDRELSARLDQEKQIMFFERLLYSWQSSGEKQTVVKSDQGSPEWRGPAQKEEETGTVNLLDLVKLAARGEPQAMDGTWSRPLVLYRSSPLAAKSSAANAAAATDMSPHEFCLMLLKNMLNFLTGTKEMAEIYGDSKIQQAHSNLWMAMRGKQRVVAKHAALGE